MNRLLFIIPTLIKINLVVALLSVVFVIIMREQQAQITAQRQQSVEQQDFNYSQIKDKIANYQQKIRQNHQKINSYEQKVKGLEAELEEYKTQNVLLMQANRTKSEKVTSAKLPQTTQDSAPSSTKAKKPISVISVSPPLTAQPQESAKPVIKAIEILEESSETENLSPPDTLEQVNVATTQDIQVEEKNVEVSGENEYKFSELNHDIAFIAQKTDQQQEFSPNPLSSDLETNPELIEPAVRSVGLDSKRDISNHYANNIAYGLAVAADAGQINHGTKMYRKVQTAIRLLRKGETTEEATRKAKVPTSVMNQLMKWGEKRPGSLIAATQEE